MSKFLGKIHYWLFNKIVWFEELEYEIVKWAKTKNINIDEYLISVYDKYGFPVEKKPLEELIDTDNIHGWLQDKIRKAELRQASIVTYILNKNPENKSELIEIFTKQGVKAGEEYSEEVRTPRDAYNALNDYILEGMPCDRIQVEVENTDSKYSWIMKSCIHEPIWNEVGGDVNNFRELREAWTKSFLKTLNSNLKYKKEDRLRTIYM